ncbi:MAG: hypothetical protein M5U09_01795 [Gammaproteobacteria bacterium]|nr:hypothetical protein [Gammaproteobacteria bacterium]
MSPSQFLGQLGAEACASTSVDLVVLPRIHDENRGWSLTRLSNEEMRSALRANRYGACSGLREATVFEELEDGTAGIPRRSSSRWSNAAGDTGWSRGAGPRTSRALAERLFYPADDGGVP